MNGIERELVEEVYDAVLQTALSVLHKASVYGLHFCRLHNPSFTELAEHLREMCKIVERFSVDLDQEIKIQKANEYANHVKLIADAIDRDDNGEFLIQLAELKRRSFL